MFQITTGGLASAVLSESLRTTTATDLDRGKPTEFQIACMTLPYSRFPLKRAFSGIQSAGYDFVAWGTAHQETPGGNASR